MPVRHALSFDDVLLVPQRTTARSRSHVDVSTRLVPTIPLRIPILSANTPWCTEAAMAEAMARLGGLGFVHRWQAVDRQVEQVHHVKTRVLDTRDLETAAVDPSGRLLVGAAIGVKGDYQQRADALLQAGADVLVLDIAHGHAEYAMKVVEDTKKRHPETPLVAGNVVTVAGTLDLIDAGADAIKVGIGPGGICTTRLVTGSGYPQLSAVTDCAGAAMERGVPVIADGGIRTSGDIVKALAAGASAVMLGSMLAGVDESSALLVEDDGQKAKISTGAVTLGMELTLKRASGIPITADDLKHYVPEGVEATFAYRGPLAETIRQLVGGIQSGFSYSGAMTIEELWRNAEFVQSSPAASAESQPHTVFRTTQVQPDYRTQFLDEFGAPDTG